MFCYTLLASLICVPQMIAIEPPAHVQGFPFMEAYTPPPSTNPLDAYASAIDPMVMYTRGPFMSAYDVKR